MLPVSLPRLRLDAATTTRRTLAVAIVLLAVLSTLVSSAAPADAGSARARTDQESWIEWQVADAITGARRSPRSVDPAAGEPAVGGLTGWTDLRGFAREWSDAMADRRTMSHNPAFADGYCCWSKAGEVLARVDVGSDVSAHDLAAAADRAMGAWFDSPPHRSTILDGAYDHVGVGVTVDHARGTIWIAVDLRRTSGSPPGSAWYREGTAPPPSPAPGWACDSDVAPYGATTWPLPDSSISRRGGQDRVATALAVADDVADPATVVLATSASPSDALAAAGLAGALDAPVLLTGGGRLDARVAAQLRQWRPARVVLAGGEQALSRRVATEVASAAPGTTVERVRGRDRYATAAAMGERLREAGGNAGRVLLALGDHPQPDRSWADAVSVSGLSASHEHPVLLTGPSSLPTPTREALRRLGPSAVVVPGGPSGVSDAVLAVVRAAVPAAEVRRVAGDDRYETSRAVVDLDQALRSDVTRRVLVVDGQDWPDALTAGPAAALSGAVVVMVEGSAAGGAGSDMDHVRDLSDRLHRLQVTLVGGPAAISDARAGAIRARLHCL